jgi:hypothetical protein
MDSKSICMNWQMLTDPSPHEEKINSQYGTISYKDWCKKEIDRINRPDKLRYRENEALCWVEFYGATVTETI